MTNVIVLFNDGTDRGKGYLDSSDNYSFCYEVNLHKDSEQWVPSAKVIDSINTDTAEMISKVVRIFKKHDGVVDIDVSVLTRFEFLFLLRMVYEVDRHGDLRVLYTEPKRYETSPYQETNMGIERISSIPGYINRAPLNRNLVLILMLGYEPGKSSAILDHMDPDETYLIIPDPPYRESWEGKTEEMNANLLEAVKTSNILRMHSSDPECFKQQFEEFVSSHNINLFNQNSRVSPLGTKPQALGLFEYWRENNGVFSLIYASSRDQKMLFDPVGKDKKHVLKDPE